MAVTPAISVDHSLEANLLRRVQAGEVEAFTPLVRQHLPSIRAFVALRLPVAHLIDEITHETFVFAFREIARFDTKQPFRPWLRAIAWNLVRTELLRFAREQVNLSRFEQVQLVELTRSAERTADRDETAFLEECLAKLPENIRRLVDERYRCGRSNDELAASFERSAEWVRITLFRIRKQLRTCIESKLAAVPHGA
jgi:RNA polymerase sigma-70 factor (ECF subfamily)